MAWKDTQGNVIGMTDQFAEKQQCSYLSAPADPDRSNPTRARMERPLDTIRSFEAAVEGTYNSRRSTFSGRPGMLKRKARGIPNAENYAASQANFNGTSRRNSSFAGMHLRLLLD